MQDATNNSDLRFSKENINLEIERIYLDDVFMRSEILRRFLSFIVDETLEGNSNQLKEYTIAVNVLNKPADFKPREDCIVRIHAGRLRRALHRYYIEKGADDPVCISIPKGSYVPVFYERNESRDFASIHSDPIPDESVIIAVIPFSHLLSDPLESSLADGLGLQLSTALMRNLYFSVISYYVTRSLSENTKDVTKISQMINAKYIVAGDIQTIGNGFRIYFQIIQVPTNKQLWCKMFERQVCAENIFELEDEIVALVFPELVEACSPKKLSVHQVEPSIAIA